jgi:hypothetical protein
MITIIAVHALLVLGAEQAQADTLIRVARGARLEVEARTQTGRIEVRGWDRDEVEVAGGPARVSTTGTIVRLDAGGGRGRGQRPTYMLNVPRWMPIDVEASGGAVTIEGAGADVSVESVGGSVRVNGGNGRVSVRSVGGTVTVENAQGRVEARSLNQSVRLTSVSGEVRAESTNGRIVLEGIESNDVLAETTNGSIDFAGAVRNDGVYRLSTHNGQISIAVPEGANATVSVSTYNGRYSSTFPIQVTQMGSDRRFTFLVGNGSARIEASSFNGNISFRRPGEPRP